MSLPARRELAAAVAVRYQAANKAAKTKILDEFVQSSGFNRKYAISVLLGAPSPAKSNVRRATPRHRRRKYGASVEHALLEVWRVAGALCPKRLHPFLPELIATLERFGEIDLCPSVRDLLVAMSISTFERILARRLPSRGISTTLPGTLLRQQIPIRTYEEWSEGRPGFFEIDLVAHCGGTASGDYAYTLTMTDIYTGWTECVALPNRSKIAVEVGIEMVRQRLPFPLLGIDSDNGAEFINFHLKDYCDKHSITFTRCRPYKKNDQCHVEQKNGAVVRPLVGYARYEGSAAVTYLNRLYAKHRICVNFFEPSMKLVSKTRTGARVQRKYDTAKTPWQRLQEAETLSEADKNRLTKQYQETNPAKLRRALEELEMGLRRFTMADRVAVAPADSAPVATVPAVPVPGDLKLVRECANSMVENESTARIPHLDTSSESTGYSGWKHGETPSRLASISILAVLAQESAAHLTDTDHTLTPNGGGTLG